MEKWKDPGVIAGWIALAGVFATVLIAFIVFFVYFSLKRRMQHRIDEAHNRLLYQQSLLGNSIETQERERTRIAADLHDELIGKLLAAQLKNALPGSQSAVGDLLTDSIAVARRVSHDLSPPLPEQVPLSELIDAILSPWKQALNIRYRTDIRSDDKLPEGAVMQLLRITQEWMSNVAKHSAATQLDVHFRQTAHALLLRIADNGRGFDPASHSTGLGLKNIEMRMHYLHGHYRLKPGKKGVSALFLLHLPYTPNNHV